MRRPALLAITAALVLAACTDAGSSEAAGDGEATAAPAAAATDSSDPDTPVSNAATPEGGATPAATATTARNTRDVDSNPPGDTCGASKVATFVSQEATPAVRARLAAEVGHNRIRWIGPDTAVTEDYSPQRLNVMLDRADVITSGRCG